MKVCIREIGACSKIRFQSRFSYPKVPVTTDSKDFQTKLDQISEGCVSRAIRNWKFYSEINNNLTVRELMHFILASFSLKKLVDI